MCSRENLSTVGNAEGKGRPLGSPRLGIASLTKTSEYRWSTQKFINTTQQATILTTSQYFVSEEENKILVFLLRPPSSPSQRSKVYTQKGVMPATPPQSSHTLAQDSQATDALTSDSKHGFQFILYIRNKTLKYLLYECWL